MVLFLKNFLGTRKARIQGEFEWFDQTSLANRPHITDCYEAIYTHAPAIRQCLNLAADSAA